MSNFTFVKASSASLCLVAMLAACSAGANTAGPTVPNSALSPLGPYSITPISFSHGLGRDMIRPPRHPLARRSGWLSPAAKSCSQKLFASSYWLDYVSVYCVKPGRHNQAPIGEITDGIDGPEGATTDADGNLYVTNTPAGTVTEYAPNSTTASFTYSTDVSDPAGVAVDASRNVYISNLGSGSITIFPQGSNSPSSTITGIPYPIDVALDSAGNLYVTSFTSSFSSGEVLEYAPGSTKGVNLGIVTGIPGGIVLDKSANIVTADQKLPGVLVFPPGVTSPSETFAQTMNDPDPVRFDRAERRVFVGDSIENDVEVFSYPSGKLVDTITDGIDGPDGVALDPAAPLSPHSW